MDNIQRIKMMEDNLHKSTIKYNNNEISFEKLQELKRDVSNRIRELKNENK